MAAIEKVETIDLSHQSLTVVRLSDTHLCADRGVTAKLPGPDYDSRERAEKILDHVRQLPDVDLILHTGDVVEREHRESYTTFDSLVLERFPDTDIFYTNGNHDQANYLRDYLRMGPTDSEFANREKLNYCFSRGAHHFIVLDGRVEDHKRSELGKESREWLQAALEQIPDGQVVWPALHFPTYNNFSWLSPRMSLEDGEQVHEIFKKFQNKIGAVLYGHIHRYCQHSRGDGVEYLSAVPGSVALTGVKGEKLRYDPDGVVGYELLRLHQDGSYSVEPVKVV